MPFGRKQSHRYPQRSYCLRIAPAAGEIRPHAIYALRTMHPAGYGLTVIQIRIFSLTIKKNG
jgi:hypothetical protein